MSSTHIKRSLFLLLLLTSLPSLASNYCGVSHYAPTYGLSYNEAMAQVSEAAPEMKDVECGLLKMLRAVQSGDANELRFPNVVLLAQPDDERFTAVANAEGLTVYHYSRGELSQDYFLAVTRAQVSGSPLAATAYRVDEFKDVTLADGRRFYMPVLTPVLRLK